ncbi:MAG: hypothetical protein RI924_1105 [Bacteroidota bacterium]|jgi:gliding motility-associated-like protein
MKKVITFLIVLFQILSWGAKGQDNSPHILNVSGNYVWVNGFVVDYSVGELTAIETFSFSNHLLTQGFLQPIPILGIGSGGLDITVWPDMSPNNDNMGHEVLFIENILNYPDNDIQIFNRWGNVIFKMDHYDNDQRSFKGKANTGMLADNAEVPDGTYYYILKVFDPVGGKTHLFNGFFVIKRK